MVVVGGSRRSRASSSPAWSSRTSGQNEQRTNREALRLTSTVKSHTPLGSGVTGARSGEAQDGETMTAVGMLFPPTVGMLTVVGGKTKDGEGRSGVSGMHALAR